MGFFSRKTSPQSPPRPEQPGTSVSTPPPSRSQRPVTPRGPHQQKLSGAHQHRQEPFQPAGFLPPPAGWNPPPTTSPPPAYTNQAPYAPPNIIVNQHYYLTPPPSGPAVPHVYSNPAPSGLGNLNQLNLSSMVDLANSIIPGNIVGHIYDDGVALTKWQNCGTGLLHQSASIYDQAMTRLNDVMTKIDCDQLSGNEKEWVVLQPPPAPLQSLPQAAASSTDLTRTKAKAAPKKKTRDAPKGQTTAVASSLISTGYVAKVGMYSNSKLPLDLPPLELYIDTYRLVCLAARYSERVYEQPRETERATHVDADWRRGIKAMRIKSIPLDDSNTIVFAIRGTASFMDWTVNLNMAPTSPQGFLDDPGNLCHAGFLSVARKMIAPVAARLRQLIQERPTRSTYSLVLTGHSAGGAVAALLFSHMLSTSSSVSSELNLLTGCFKRIHCITFGTPPVSLLPLEKPRRAELKKFLFLSFVNEGDPVARADKAYVRSLLDLFSSPPPEPAKKRATSKDTGGGSSGNKVKTHDNKSKTSVTSTTSKASAKSSQSNSSKTSKSRSSSKPVWPVPPSTLSNAGRIIVLRSGDPKARNKGDKTVEERLNEGVVAQVTTDAHLRGVIWGDPVCHVMKMYVGRVETLAAAAITAQGL